MIDDLPDDQPLEVLVWTLARDAKDLRERVEFGVWLDWTLRREVRAALRDLSRATEGFGEEAAE